MTEYTFMVCGLVFNSDQSKIALILKNRPKFLAGKMNGIGGKVEIGEGHAESMSREFEEETGWTAGSRPGSGFYNDHAPRGMIEKALAMARQIRRRTRVVDVNQRRATQR